MDRYLPLGLGATISTLAASILDVNWGAMAGGITVVSAAAGAGYWNFAVKRTAALKDAEAAKVEIYRINEAAKLEVFRAAELARIEIQRQQDEVNKGSLTAQLTTMNVQLTAIQGSLEDAREVNASLRARLEDANRKLHDLLNDENAKRLKHAAEKMELEQKYGEIVAKLDAAHAENVGLLARLGDNAAATSAQADRNSARLDALEGP